MRTKEEEMPQWWQLNNWNLLQEKAEMLFWIYFQKAWDAEEWNNERDPATTSMVVRGLALISIRELKELMKETSNVHLATRCFVRLQLGHAIYNEAVLNINICRRMQESKRELGFKS